MSLQFGLCAPVCGGWLRIQGAAIETDPGPLVTLAQTADRLGYDFYYVPEHYLNAVHGPEHPVADAWVVSSAAVAVTQRIRVIPAVQPGFKLPGVVAKMGATLARFRPSAFGLSIIAGWWKLEVENYDDRWLPHAERYARSAEFLDVIRGFWTDERFDYEGKYFRVAGGTLEPKPRPPCPVFIAGESAPAIELAARAGDYLFINGAEPACVGDLVHRAKTLAKEKYGRTLQVALSAFGLVRPTEREAEAHVDDLRRRADAAKIAYFRTQIDGAVTAHNRGSDADQIEANLGLTSGLIGDAPTILRRLHAFEEAGVDAVILKLEPSADEVERFARAVIEPYRAARGPGALSPL